MLTKKEALEKGYKMCSRYDSFYDIEDDELSEGEYTLVSTEKEYWSVNKEDIISVIDQYLTDQLADNISWNFASNILLEDDMKNDKAFQKAVKTIVKQVNLLLKQYPYYIETDEKMVIENE